MKNVLAKVAQFITTFDVREGKTNLKESLSASDIFVGWHKSLKARGTCIYRRRIFYCHALVFPGKLDADVDVLLPNFNVLVLVIF